MIPKLKDFLGLLEHIAPARLAEPWDNPGLQVGSYSQEIRKIRLALDPTLNTLRKASETGSQLLLTHHPLIFKPLSSLEINAYPQNVIFEASRRGISVVAAHTNLDVAKGGMNDILADLLGLNRVEVLEEADQGNGVGMGRIGDLTEPTTLSGMIKHVKRILAIEKLTIVAQGNALIRRVAVVAGSGGSLLRIASEKGADLLLTGDVSHHHALEAETLRIALIDGGHFHTEKIAFRHFGDRLKEEIVARGWEVALEFDEDEFDPKREV